MRKLLLIAPFIFFTITSYGQRARLFSTDSELSNSLIGDIVQDHKGIIWVATEDGINRYDGSKFSYYREKNGILSNNVKVVYEDSRHDLYIGYFNGLQEYNRATDSFEKIPLILESGSEYPAHVMSMVEKKDGTRLVATSGYGIFKIHETDSGKIARQQDLVPSYLVNLIYEDSFNNLWVSTQDMGLFRIRKNKQNVNYLDIKNGLDNNVTSVCQDSAGNIYAGSLRKGLFRYNPTSDLFEKLPMSEKHPLPVQELFPTQNNELLIGTDGKGMKIYDASLNRISNLNFNISNFDFSKSKVHTIVKDHNNNLWLGLFQKGVALIPSRPNNFKYIGYQSVTNNIIGSNYIMSVYKDHEGILWVGTDSDGLYKISSDGELLKHYPPSGPNGTTPSTVMCIFEDSKNNLWIGSYLKGLLKFDRKKNTFTPITTLLDEKNNPIHRVYSLTEDNENNLWVATLGFGLYSMNLDNGDVKNYHGRTNPAQTTDTTNSIHNSWLSDILLTSDNELVIGTMDGLSSLNLETKTFTNLNSAYYPLKGQRVLSLFEDPKGNVWVGTISGLLCLDRSKRSFVKYTTKDGLPNDVICAISSDDSNNIWISTNHGISKFNPLDSSFLNYYYHDGLQGNEFSKRALFKDDEGRFIFGGINGITYFKPEDIKETLKNLKVELIDFYIHDEPVKKGMKSDGYDIIDTSVMDAETFNLGYTDNSFTIEFSAMEYLNPKRITYLYSMNGGDWVSLQQGVNTVTFDNLDIGHYNFRVRANDFHTYSDVKEISVIIFPPWYLSGWAKLGYFATSILFILLIAQQTYHRYKTHRKIREHKQLEQINEAKLEFFTNISHEIRTPLSLILNPLRKLILSDDDNMRQRAYTVMRRNTERVLHLVNQLMDLRKIDHGKISLKFKEIDIVKFLHETTEMFQEQILAKELDFMIVHKKESPMVWVDQNYFDKTIHNLLSNAIKFTPQKGKIQMCIETHDLPFAGHSEHTHLKLTCIDSGTGLKDHEFKKIFNRFYQSADNKESHIGTGIGLHLTRTIVELHHGTIHAENNPDGVGCRFIVSIPLGKEHLDPLQIEREQIDTEIYHSLETIPPLPFKNYEDDDVKSKSKKYVLVVDDDADIRQYICKELAREYHMIDCANGEEALSFTLSKKPDLIISDIMMSEMNGITLCRKLKQNVNTNHIPVILLTAKSGEKDNLEGLGIGADAYILKPFNMEILKKTVENIIKNREILKNNFSGSQFQSDKVKSVELESADERLMQKVMTVINENIDNPALNVEMIAHEIGISRVHLYRKLKELTNQSVRELIRNIRLTQAAELLTTKTINISQVAYATGFSNPSKFSTSFKEVYGVSPKAYMEKHHKGIS
ncbi:two-component regulator propeller domain-containing protein [Fulvivirga lutimaris]|uniref:two-component regulator propeller domain-containing protein n=1 Tax=Fulvivirga lutimaris TaxID=1819566 RepID=UPI001C86874F